MYISLEQLSNCLKWCCSLPTIDGFGKVVNTFTVEGSSQVTCDVRVAPSDFDETGCSTEAAHENEPRLAVP